MFPCRFPLPFEGEGRVRGIKNSPEKNAETNREKLDLLQKSEAASFPEFFDRKNLKESQNISLLWIALEFVLRQIRAMTEERGGPSSVAGCPPARA